MKTKMKIETLKIKVKDLIQDYFDDGDGGVSGYGGKLTIRPPYQREFIYDMAQQEAVITSILKGYPLGEMYWGKTANGNFEIIDGQQRTISICAFANNEYSVEEEGKPRNCEDLTGHEAFMEYPLTIHVCDGDDEARLDWFQIINSHGEPLNDQELLNATYSGPFVTEARRLFKSGGGADKLRAKHVGGSALRQELLRTALEWKSGAMDAEKSAAKRNIVAAYMSKHRKDADEAQALYRHFNAVINWAIGTFGAKAPTSAKSVGKGWGRLYREYGKNDLDRDYLQRRLKELTGNENIQRKAGIYEYLLKGETLEAERHLNLRQFDPDIRMTAYEQQGGLCAITGEHLPIEEMEADHKVPWSKGGGTTLDNCQMVSRYENRRKGAK